MTKTIPPGIIAFERPYGIYTLEECNAPVTRSHAYTSEITYEEWVDANLFEKYPAKINTIEVDGKRWTLDDFVNVSYVKNQNLYGFIKEFDWSIYEKWFATVRIEIEGQDSTTQFWEISKLTQSKAERDSDPLTAETLLRWGFKQLPLEKYGSSYHGRADLNFGYPVLKLSEHTFLSANTSGECKYLFLDHFRIPCSTLGELKMLYKALTGNKLKPIEI